MAPSKGEGRGGDPAEGEDEESASVGRCARSGGICPTRRHADDEARSAARTPAARAAGEGGSRTLERRVVPGEMRGKGAAADVVQEALPTCGCHIERYRYHHADPRRRRPVRVGDGEGTSAAGAEEAVRTCGSYTDTPPRSPTPVSASTALGIKGGRGGRGPKNKRNEMRVEVSRGGVPMDSFEESVARCGFRNPRLVRRCPTQPGRDTTRGAQTGAAASCIPVAAATGARGGGGGRGHDDYAGTSRPRAAQLHAPTTDLPAEIYDTGGIEGPSGSFTVNNVQGKFAGYVLHTGSSLEGPDSKALSVGDEVKCKEVIGDRIDQKGSIVLPEKLRFDFSHGTHFSNTRDAAEEDIAKGVQRRTAVTAECAKQAVKLASSIETDINETSNLDGATLEKDAFVLSDTYGYPIDLTEVMAVDLGPSVDMEGFNVSMEEARQKARNARYKAAGKSIVLDANATSHLRNQGLASINDSPEFQHEVHSTVVKAIYTGSEFIATASGDEDFGLVLESTSFYAEQGGQIYDTGSIEGPSGSFTVNNVQVFAGYVLHIGSFLEGPDSKALSVGDEVKCKVDYTRRTITAPNHTCTHMPNFPLRDADKKGHGAIGEEALTRVPDFFCSDRGGCPGSNNGKWNYISKMNYYLRAGEASSSYSTSSSTNISAGKTTQILVKFFGSTIPVRKNLNKLSAKMLIEHVCRRVGVRQSDLYTTFSGRILEPEQVLSYYQLQKDSMVYINHRLRGGRPLTIEVETWDAKMKVYPHYQTLPLDPDLIGPNNKKKNVNAVTYLSESLQYLCKQVLVGMCREHFSGISFGGNFTSKQLLFDNGNFRFDTCVPIEEYSITSAFKDYKRISEIFDKEFCSADGSYPIHAGHLINFLACPPDLVDPRSEALIAYLTNHYSLLSHSQRIKMSEVLDSLRAMLGTDGLLDYKFAIGIWGSISWTDTVKVITGMKPVYLYDATYDKRGYVIDVPYSNHDNLSLLHFSNNFFKHAKFPLQQREAAFSLAMKDDNFMPKLLFDSAITFQNVVAYITEDVQQFIDEVISMLGKNTLCCKRRDEPSTS